MLRTPEQIIAFAAATPSLSKDQDRSEVRMYASFIAGILLLWLIEPLAYVVWVPESVIYDVAKALTFPRLVVWSSITGIILVVPHLFSLCFLPKTLHLVWPRIFAAIAAYLACITWLYLSWASIPLDFGPVWVPYTIRAIGSLLVALAFMKSINVQQIKAAAAYAQRHRMMRLHVEDLKGATRA